MPAAASATPAAEDGGDDCGIRWGTGANDWQVIAAETMHYTLFHQALTKHGSGECLGAQLGAEALESQSGLQSE